MRMRTTVIADGNQLLAEFIGELEIGGSHTVEIPWQRLNQLIRIENGAPFLDIQRLAVQTTWTDRRRKDTHAR